MPTGGGRQRPSPRGSLGRYAFPRALACSRPVPPLPRASGRASHNPRKPPRASGFGCARARPSRVRERAGGARQTHEALESPRGWRPRRTPRAYQHAVSVGDREEPGRDGAVRCTSATVTVPRPQPRDPSRTHPARAAPRDGKVSARAPFAQIFARRPRPWAPEGRPARAARGFLRAAAWMRQTLRAAAEVRGAGAPRARSTRGAAACGVWNAAGTS